MTNTRHNRTTYNLQHLSFLYFHSLLRNIHLNDWPCLGIGSDRRWTKPLQQSLKWRCWQSWWWWGRGVAVRILKHDGAKELTLKRDKFEWIINWFLYQTNYNHVNHLGDKMLIQKTTPSCISPSWSFSCTNIYHFHFPKVEWTNS